MAIFNSFVYSLPECKKHQRSNKSSGNLLVKSSNTNTKAQELLRCLLVWCEVGPGAPDQLG
jgi:hypothetical protein